MPVTRRRAVTLFAIAAAVLLVLDRATKAWAMDSIPSGGLEFLSGAVGWFLVYNRGASFGMLEGATWVFILLSLVLSVLIVVYLVRYRKHPGFEAVILGVVFAGAVGNAIDRLAYGHVVDFIHLEFIDFPVFNVADICITLGMISWVLFMIFHPLSPFSAEVEEGRGERAGVGFDGVSASSALHTVDAGTSRAADAGGAGTGGDLLTGDDLDAR